MENSKNSSLSKLIPVMLCFFAMGFVDLVGIASNYVRQTSACRTHKQTFSLHSSFFGS